MTIHGHASFVQARCVYVVASACPLAGALSPRDIPQQISI